MVGGLHNRPFRTRANLSKGRLSLHLLTVSLIMKMNRIRTHLYFAPRVALLILGIALGGTRVFALDPYAKAIVYANILNGNVGNSNPTPADALGAPDDNSVSMGGPGASLILDMGAETPVLDGPGADVQVLELGAAYGGADESYNVYISNSTDTNTFVFVGRGRALSLLDIHATGLTSARYVWLQDLATETLNTTVPGSDIDSVRVLYYSGSSNDVVQPSGATVRLTGQGAWLSWTASSDTNVTGYAIRRSLDGVAFGSTADYTATKEETAWHDLNLPVVSNFFYAVSTLAGTNESVPVVVGVPAYQLALLTNHTAHAGDDTVAAWEVPASQRTVTISFTLPDFADGPLAELALELFDVDNSGNAILVNGAEVAPVPTQPSENWTAKIVQFAAGALLPGTNTLVFSARNSSGGTTGSLDDFQLRNVWLRLYGPQTNLDLFTRTRFTHISAGQTNVTLRWVVEQTPTVAPVDWQTVSSPIEWKGVLVPTNGFFRLRDAP